jgi:DNA-binding NarL/FixJ family response regulator
MAGRLLAEFRRGRADNDGADRSAEAQSDLRSETQRSHLPPRPAAPQAPPAGLAAADLARFPLASAAAQILTRRELETLQYVADGLSNKEIGQRLSITEGTVKNHVHNALEKLQLENRIQAAAYVVRQGIAHPPSSN